MTPPRALTILILAGEPSGDEHAARVAVALRSRWPECRLVGTGGPRMASAGVDLIARLDDLAVMGFVEVVSRLPFFARLERKVEGLLAQGVDLVIPVDYPGFNLRITDKCHRLGTPVVFYIAPQVWAWKAGRAARLAAAADRVAVILPFEEEIFRKEGGKAVFVGHPLLDRDPGLPSRTRGSTRTERSSRSFPGRGRRRSEGTSVPSSRPAPSSVSRGPGSSSLSRGRTR
jgi:lipid-A-disaccharide synthase